LSLRVSACGWPVPSARIRQIRRAITFAPKTTFRAGYGTFFAQGNRGIGAVSSELGQGYQTSTAIYLGPAGANPYLPPPGASLANPFVTGFVEPPSNLVGTGVTTTIRNQPNPIQHQWTASLQRQLTSTLMIEAAYAGSRGEHLWQELRYDAVNPVYLSLGTAAAEQTPNPFFGKISTGALSASTVAARYSCPSRNTPRLPCTTIPPETPPITD
jgi:hypothetical protein